ncbi:MAG TPA: Zn-ribbon domain-containing OB-fold protein [Burkholderiales bacterium]|nr:Zn-ribbon domain-containing OB-fold protein [Burkholderiales bacterium]
MATRYREREIPAPLVNAENKPFFDAAAQGKLLVKFCTACGEYHHYPRAFCPYCFSDRTEWRESEGTGTIYTWSVLRRGVPAPYCLAYVTLAEGVSMITNIVDCDLDGIRIGQKVRVVFKPTDGGPPVPMFRPA